MNFPPPVLLWIGDRNDRFLAPVADWCERHFAAVTRRPEWTRDCTGEGSAPSLSWTHLVVARHHSARIDGESLERWIKRHTDSWRAEVRSPLCREFNRFGDPRFNAGVLPSVAAIAAIARSLVPTHSSQSIRDTAPKSHLVIADRFDTADAIAQWVDVSRFANRVSPPVESITIERSFEAAASPSHRGITDYWWDESIGQPEALDQWIQTKPNLRFKTHHYLTDAMTGSRCIGTNHLANLHLHTKTHPAGLVRRPTVEIQQRTTANRHFRRAA